MRGIAIILVVVGHLLQFNNIDGGVNNILFNIIYSFHMPLFFFISGYTQQKTDKLGSTIKSHCKFVINKCFQLMIPCLLWGGVIKNLFFCNETPSAIGITISSIGSILKYYWFLSLLFVTFIPYVVYHYLLTKVKTVYIVKDLLLIGIIIILTIISFLVSGTKIGLYPIFFWLGLLVAKYDSVCKAIMNKYVFAISFLLFYLGVNFWEFGSTNTLNYVLQIIIASFAIISIYNIVKLFVWKESVNNMISLFGRESLSIYLCQFFITKLFISSNIIVLDFNPMFLFPILVLISIPICYVCIAIKGVISTSQYLRFALYGNGYKLK